MFKYNIRRNKTPWAKTIVQNQFYKAVQKMVEQYEETKTLFLDYSGNLTSLNIDVFMTSEDVNVSKTARKKGIRVYSPTELVDESI